MRKIKEYLKLIFAAVVCFFMKIVPEKKAGKQETAGNSGNLIADTGKSGRETGQKRTSSKNNQGILAFVHTEKEKDTEADLLIRSFAHIRAPNVLGVRSDWAQIRKRKEV